MKSVSKTSARLERLVDLLPTGVNIEFFDYQRDESTGDLHETIQEMKWLHRFPFLENLSLLASEENNFVHSFGKAHLQKESKRTQQLSIPYITSHKLQKNKVLLPLGYAAPLAFPEGLPPAMPDYMYSSLAVFHEGEWVFFDRDYTSSEDFWNHFKNIPRLSEKEKLFWGIIVLKDKLPHPIAISSQTSFHLGYNDQRLPQTLHLSLSSRCNIRCTICGAQNSFKEQGKKGHIIDTKFLLKIADVFLPYIATVEFNSFGEQLLYEDFPLLMSLLNKYGCHFMLQTNGTTLPDKKMDAILSGRGFITFSIDAMGEIFESQRVGAKWNVVEENVKRLLSKRDPERIKVGINPAITCKTLPSMLDLCRWAEHVGIDYVYLHYYDPIDQGVEKRPSLEEQNKLFQMLKEYIDTENPNLFIMLESQQLSCGCTPMITRDLLSTHKYSDYDQTQKRKFYSEYRCMLPSTTVQITPDEMFFPGCCKLHRRIFSCPTTDEDFFSLWFGKDLTRLRDSLKLEPPHPPMVQECLKCVAEGCRQKLKY